MDNFTAIKNSARFLLSFLLFTPLFVVQSAFAQACNNPNNPFGCVLKPDQLPDSGLLALLNNILRLVFIFAGIFAFLRFIVAGLTFMNAGGDVKKIQQAWTSIWQSLLGLIIMLGAFAMAVLMGQILFGSWDAILYPKIYGPT